MGNPTPIAESIDNRWLNRLVKKYPPMYGFDSIKFKESPEPPIELIEYRRLSFSKKRSEEEKFYSQKFIQDYLEVKWNVELYNRDEYCWLLRLLSDDFIFADKVSTQDKEKIKRKIEDFEDGFRNNVDPPFIVLNVDGVECYVRAEKNKVSWFSRD